MHAALAFSTRCSLQHHSKRRMLPGHVRTALGLHRWEHAPPRAQGLRTKVDPAEVDEAARNLRRGVAPWAGQEAVAAPKVCTSKRVHACVHVAARQRLCAAAHRPRTLARLRAA